MPQMNGNPLSSALNHKIWEQLSRWQLNKTLRNTKKKVNFHTYTCMYVDIQEHICVSILFGSQDNPYQVA